MKKYYYLLTFLFVGMYSIAGFAQEDQDLQTKGKKEDIKLDTRIDNMGYWNRMIELGVTKGNPSIPFKPAEYKGSLIEGKGIKAQDSPDVPVTSATNVTETENSIFIDPNDNQYVLNSNNSTSWTGSSVGSLYGANYFQSADGGAIWGGSASGAGGSNSGDPTTAINSSGTQFINYISSSSGQGIAYSTNGGTSWTTATVGPNPGSLADKNHMWIDNSPTSTHNGNLYVAWTDFGGTYDSEIVLSRSTNNAVSWSTRINVSAASNAGSHNQGVNIQTGPNGDVYLVWAIYDSWPSDETRLAMAKSTNGGASFGSSYNIITNIKGIRNTEVPQNMRVNSFPVMAVDISGGSNNGNIYVIWTNVGTPGVNSGTAGVYMIRSTNGGTAWSSPIKVNQGTGTAYQPWITCDSETGDLAIVYYDNRNTVTTDAEAWVSYSLDAGSTWTDMRVSDVSFTPTPISGLASGYMGDYLAITSKGGRVYPCWADNRGSTYMTYVSPFDLGLTASFTANNTNICVGSSVTFTDQSSGSPTSWTWSFPSGTPSSYSGQNPPAITYNSSGTYNVILTVGDGSTTNTETKTGYINVENIIADFSGSPTTVVAGNTVTFTDNSDCSPTSWSWSFPGGTPATATGPGPHTITYNTIGTYNVSLIASNASYSDTETKVGYIDVINCNYCTIYYSNTSDDYISNVSFNTINNSSGSTTYSDFTGISTNINTGNSYNISVDITVNGTWDQYARVWIDWNRDCDFDDSGEQFDIGITPGTTGTHTLSTSISVPGTAVLGATRMRVAELYNAYPGQCDNETYGEGEDYTVVIQSSSTPPVANFTADDTTPGVGQTVQFTDNSSNTPTSWSWSFNPTSVTYVGGTNSSSQNPQVQFNASGYYTVTLTATNIHGSDPETKTNYILAGTAGNWTGAVSIDWNTAGNWENLTVPTSTDDVTIPATATNWPTFTGDFALGSECNDMTLEGSAQFTSTGDISIPAGMTLTCNGLNDIFVGGDWNLGGTFNPGSGAVNFAGNSNVIIDAGGSASNSLQTTFTSNNGSYGNMFDIVALNDVTVSSFEANLDGGSQTVYIYYKVGTYVGYETNSSVWTLIGSTTVTSTGNGSGTPIPIAVNISIPSGQTYSFYVQSSLGNNYTNGSTAGNVYVSDANMQILEGCGKGTPLFTGGTYSPRVFNGIVHYSYSSGTGAAIYNHLTISKTNAEVTTNADVNVQGNLRVNSRSQFTNASGNTLAVAGNALFVSDANGMASYLDNGTTTISGNTSYQEYLTSQRWHLVSPPVSGASIDVYFDIYLKEYNEPTDTWTYLVTPTTMPMNVGQGYAAWASDDYTGPTTVTYTGTLTNNNILLNSLDYTSVATKAGFNLIGNPYPCALDWNTNWSMSNMSGWMVVYDNGTYRGIHTDGTPYNGKTDGIIPPTQGFWVRALNSSGSITIPAAERLHSGQAFYKEVSEFNYPVVRLETEINGYTDETVVIFHPEATEGFDGYYDLSKFENVEEAPQLYTMTEGGNYAVNFYGEDYQEKVIPVGFKTLSDGLYSIQAATISNFSEETGIYLEDLKTGIITKLSDNPQYDFSYNSSDEEHRFNLHFTNTSLDIIDVKLSGMDIYAYQSTVYIKNPALLDGNIVIYDVMGQEIINQKTSNEALIQINVNQGMGYYFVKIESGKKALTEKVFIK